MAALPKMQARRDGLLSFAPATVFDRKQLRVNVCSQLKAAAGNTVAMPTVDRDSNPTSTNCSPLQAANIVGFRSTVSIRPTAASVLP